MSTASSHPSHGIAPWETPPSALLKQQQQQPLQHQQTWLSRTVLRPSATELVVTGHFTDSNTPDIVFIRGHSLSLAREQERQLQTVFEQDLMGSPVCVATLPWTEDGWNHAGVDSRSDLLVVISAAGWYVIPSGSRLACESD